MQVRATENTTFRALLLRACNRTPDQRRASSRGRVEFHASSFSSAVTSVALRTAAEAAMKRSAESRCRSANPAAASAMRPSSGIITRNEAGDLVIHPLRVQRGTALMQALKALGEVDEDFIAALEAEQEAPLQTQEREAL